MSSVGGQWRVLRHLVGRALSAAEADRLLQGLRQNLPQQWEGLVKRLEKLVALRDEAVSGVNGRVLASTSVGTPPDTVHTPLDTPPDEKAASSAETPPVDTNTLPSHVKDISWEGLMQGLRLKKDLHFGNITQHSWKSNKPIVSKSSIECRTWYVVSAVCEARAPACVRKRAEDLVHHLHTYPRAADLARRAGAVRALLRAQRRLPHDEPESSDACDAINEALALVGWAGAPGGRCVRVLSLDGGGVRGLAALALLRALEQRTGRKVEELFDLVVGVSTGAIIAGIIGSGVGDLETASRMYVKLSREMFGNTSLLGGASRLVWTHSYYDTEAWERMLRDNYGEVTLSGCARARRPRLALVSVARGADGRAAPFLFRSYGCGGGAGPACEGTVTAPLWAAVRASAAAPTYFTEYRHAGVVHQDGGLAVNNPAGLALQEARRVWPGARLLLVSVGTGRAPPAAPPTHPHTAPPAATAPVSWRDKFNTILDSATDTEGVHLLLNEVLPADSYFRFNPPLTEPCAMDEIDPRKIQHMMDDTHAYIRRNQYKLCRAGALLSARRGLLQRAGDALREHAARAGLLH